MTKMKSDKCTPGGNAFACGLPTPHLDGIPTPVQPLMQLGLPLQGDWIELCGHRASAWLEWPVKICACKSMTEVTTAHSEYLTAMSRHYADYLDSVLRDTLVAHEEFAETSEDDTPAEETSPKEAPVLDREAA